MRGVFSQLFGRARQFGVATPEGVDILVHMCQLALAGDPDAVLFLTDFANG